MRYNLAFRRGGPVLSGAVNGRAAFAAMIHELQLEPKSPAPLFIDFKDVEVATASYIRESVFALKTFMRSANSKLYPVVANVNESVYDELLTVANAKSDAIISCRLGDDDVVSDVSLIGYLDAKQQMTFDLVYEVRDADANQLMEQFGEAEQTTSTTAWNNRLAGLAAKGLIREFARGRAKYYRPVLEVTT